MEVVKKLNILSTFLGEYSKAGNEYLFYCPFCDHHKKKLSINLSKNKYKCWVCDQSGNTRKLVRSKATYEVFLKWKRLDNEIDLSINLNDIFLDKDLSAQQLIQSLPEEFSSLTAQDEKLKHRRPLSYLRKRGVTKEDILYWKIGFCYDGEYKDRIIIPSFDLNGNLNNYVGRGITKSVYPKYKAPAIPKDIIFNELYLNFDDDLIIVEGVFDAIKAGSNSVPILGSTIREESKLFQKLLNYDTAVYMALDPNASKKENRIMREMIKYGLEVYKIEVSPFNDVGEMTKEDFQKRKLKAEIVTHDSLIRQELNMVQ